MYIEKLENYLKEQQIGKLATISGRYYSMDREKMWDKTKKSYDTILGIDSPIISDYETVLAENYRKGIYDVRLLIEEYSKNHDVTDANRLCGDRADRCVGTVCSCGDNY